MKNNLNLNLIKKVTFNRYFEGDETTTVTTTGNDTVTVSNNNGNDIVTVTNPNTNNQNKTFTQEEFNKALAEDRRKHAEQVKKYIGDLENLRKNTKLTEQEKNSLEARIQDLQTQIMSKEQLAEQEKKKLANQYQTEVQTIKAEKDIWKNRFTESTIIRSITDAAVELDAYNPSQIVALLQGQTRLAEETDAEGRTLGVFSPRVKFHDTDAEGKPTVLDLSIKDAIKRMKDLPEKYGNLFKSNLNGGLGNLNNQNGTGRIDASKVKSIQDYKKYRDKILKK